MDVLKILERPRGRRMVPIVSVLACLAGLGCGAEGEDRPELVAVEGTIEINGEPPEGAMLVFHPADGEAFDARGSRPRATVSEDGSFSVTTYRDGDGIPVGEYDVAILWFDNPDSSSPHDKLGGRYARPEQADIRVSVDQETTQLEPITIEGARIVPRRPRSGSGGADFDQVE